jgi:hypothetical protein
MAASLAGVSWATAGDEKAATESAADNAMSHLFALPMVRLLTRVLERHAAFWRSASRFFCSERARKILIPRYAISAEIRPPSSPRDLSCAIRVIPKTGQGKP